MAIVDIDLIPIGSADTTPYLFDNGKYASKWDVTKYNRNTNELTSNNDGEWTIGSTYLGTTIPRTNGHFTNISTKDVVNLSKYSSLKCTYQIGSISGTSVLDISQMSSGYVFLDTVCENGIAYFVILVATEKNLYAKSPNMLGHADKSGITLGADCKITKVWLE